MKQRILIKLGGSILDDIQLVKSICSDLAVLQSAGKEIVLVHGGGKAIDQALQHYQIKSEFHEGLRITSDAMMDVIEMVLCGKMNKLLVRTLSAAGVAAQGVSGADNKFLCGKVFCAQHGRVGVIKTVNAHVAELLLDAGILPVIAPVGVDENFNTLNINADWAASYIAVAMQANKLIYLTDQDGIYDENRSVISELNTFELESLIKLETVTQGMLPKVKAILHALNQGIDDVHVINAKSPHSLLEKILLHKNIGTCCKKEICYES